MITSPTSSSPSLAADELSLLDILNIFIRRRQLIVGTTAAAGILSIIVSLFLPPRYTATATFVAESATGSVPSSLSGIASQLGISPGSSRSPQFYADVLTSRAIIDRLLQTRFPVPPEIPIPRDSTSLIQLLDVDGRTAADSLAVGRETLVRSIAVGVSRQTSMVRLDVDTRSPSLSAAVANALIEELNRFNAESRQSQARERRRFIEQRLESAEAALRASEEARRTFFERNRNWQGSPLLALEEDRLRREIQLRQDVFVSLSREYESTRIEEVNDTPVITVVDSAVAPVEKSKPRRRLIVIGATALAFVLSTLTAFVLEFFASALRSDGRASAEFQQLVATVRGSVSRLLNR